MIQRVLDQRYELIEKVGVGGMADVYRARDQLLDRPVAVKILHDQFKSDTEFIEKFHHEAQGAAKLSHPNIVNIYDVGESQGEHYIVMEYVPGNTLKEYIREKGHLEPAEAMHIAREIASALAHAHANNLVHCDIKPHNILMMPGGDIKVADFGIARAVTESTMTYSSNVVGSVHYFSPEQAKGTLITPKSDVYSLGIVMYEMLTGSLPFTGETPVSVAMKQLQEEPKPLRQLNPEIPPVVEALVMRAMSKDPDQRPTSAELMQEIGQAEQLIGSAGGSRMAAAPDPFATQVMPRVSDVGTPAAASAREAEPDEPENKSVLKSKKFVIGLIIVLIAGFFVGGFMGYGKFWSGAEVVVPDVTGKQMALAKQILEDNKLRVNVAETYDASVPAGVVVSQDPEAGSKVKEERTVTIYVSKGGEEITMPDLKGLSKADALDKLKKMGLEATVYEKESDKEAGTVIEQDPRAGSKVSKGTSVEIIISKGKKSKKATVPGVVGLNLSDAKATLASQGFKVNVQHKADAQAKDTVISQSPSAGDELANGGSVTLIVSTGIGKSENKSDNSKSSPDNQTAVPTKGNSGKGQ